MEENTKKRRKRNREEQSGETNKFPQSELAFIVTFIEVSGGKFLKNNRWVNQLKISFLNLQKQ